MGVRLEKKFDWVKYQVFLINGSGQNQVDTNLQKDLAVRLELTPFEGFTFGGSGLTSLWQRTTQATTKDKVEAFGRLNVSGLLIQGELLWGKTGATGAGVERTKAAGRYATVGYTIAGRLQPVFRYGYLNTDKTVTIGQSASYALFSPFGVATDEVRGYEVGLNYYLQGNEWKLQAAYGFYDFDDIPALQEFTLAAQAAF
jgi:phosphate-selective porin